MGLEAEAPNPIPAEVLLRLGKRDGLVADRADGVLRARRGSIHREDCNGATIPTPRIAVARTAADVFLIDSTSTSLSCPRQRLIRCP